MDTDGKTKKRFSFLVNLLYFGAVIAILYFIIKKYFWVIAPFLIAFVVAAVLQKPINYFTRKVKVPRGLLSTVGVILLLGVVAGLFIVIGARIAAELQNVFSYISARLQNLPQLLTDIEAWVLNAIKFLPDMVEEKLSGTITQFMDDLIENGFSGESIGALDFNWSSLISTGGGVLVSTIGQIPSILIGVLVTVVACVFMTTDYDVVMGFFLRQLSPARAEQMIKAKHICFSTARKMIKAYAIIIVITTTELSIALSILSLLNFYTTGHIFMVSVIIAIIDIIPVLGTGTVLIPWIVISLLSGHFGLGIGLLISYAAITVIRQIIEPKLVAGQVGLPPIVTITAMYIGTKALGIFGFFILPFMVILLKSLNDSGVIHLFKTENDVNKEDEPGQDNNEPVTENKDIVKTE